MSTSINYVSPGVIRVTDKGGATTEYQFTADGSLQQVTDPLGRTSRWVYDTNGRAVQAIAADNSVTSFSYDAAGRVSSKTNALNQVETYSYGPNSKSPTSLVDGKGNPLTYSYDSQGKVTSIGYADGSSETFTYNSTNQLISKVERSGDTFSYSYNPRGLLASKSGPDFSESYSYDSQDRLLAVSRSTTGGGASQSVSYSYDSGGNIAQISQGGKSISYSYDHQGRRNSYSTSDGATVRYSYDSSGRLSGLRDGSDQSLVGYQYDAAGRLSRETNGNGTATSYSYDAAGQLLRIDNANPAGTVVSSLVYTYDLLGRRTGETSNQGSWSYSYDASGQLVGANFASSNPAAISNQSRQYVYDAAGNRISTLVNGVATSYSSNALNQYTAVGGASYSYDADGNLLSDGVRSYQYNSENRMIRATASADVWEYEYDLRGNRSAVIHNGQRTSYLVDPFAGYGDVVGIYNADGSLQARYVHGNGLVAGFTDGGSWYYEADALGSTRSVSNGSGAALTPGLVYDPFGAELGGGSGLAVAQGRFGFVGGWGVEQDASGLIHMRARQYDSIPGRFLGSDPILEKGGNLNLYSYTLNNPVLYNDPSGLHHNDPPAECECKPDVDEIIIYVEAFIPYDNVDAPFPFLTGYSSFAGDGDFRPFTPDKRNSRMWQEIKVTIDNSKSNISYSYDEGTNPTHGITTTGHSNSGIAGTDNMRGDADGSIKKFKVEIYGDADNPLIVSPSINYSYTIEFERLHDKYTWKLHGSHNRYPAHGVYITNQSVTNLVVQHDPRATGDEPLLGLVTWKNVTNAGHLSNKNPTFTDDPEKCDPLVLDLSGDGLEFIPLFVSRTHFDLDNNGVRERVSWVGTGEGLLVRDLNNNGRIDHLGEQFGDAVVNGFTALAALDSNGDNFIDASDVEFDSLRIWIDRNVDGSTDTGELRTLADLNIQSIGLARVDRTDDPDGIRSTGSFTFTDGTTSTIAAIDLTIDRVTTRSTQAVNLKAETAYLPGLKGFGALSDLNVAMSQDPVLLGLMREFVQLDASQLDQINAKIEAILFRWAGVDGIDPNSRSAFFDARKHAFLEKFYQSNLEFSITKSAHASGLRHSWAAVVAYCSDRLAGQSFLRHLLSTPASDYNYDLAKDKFLGSADSAQPADHLQAILSAVQLNFPADTSAQLLTWSYVLGVLNAVADRFGLTGTAFDATLQQALGPELAGYLTALRNPVLGSAVADDLLVQWASGGEAGVDPGPLFISAGDGDDTITSGNGDDLQDGGAGNDRLKGNRGNDRLFGGAGNDVYIVDSTTDGITDSDGIDTVQSSVSFSLAPFSFLENLTLTGSSAINATGNDQANTLTGNSAKNILNGGGGNDILIGGRGNDTLDGGAGIDSLDGGTGNDTYIVDSTTDGITDSQGIDTVQSSVSFSLASFSFLEYLTLTGNATINATGNGANNTLTGNSANNILDGGAGRDTLTGGSGNDTYIVDSTTDVITDSQGIDTVQSSVSFSLAPFSFLEHLTLTGNATINATGNDQANTLTGNSANNILDGGTGIDTLDGGVGNDTYIVDSTTDGITDSDGIDTVQSSVSFSLAPFSFLENLTLTGSSAINATGNDQANTLTGNSANNILDGGGGNDILIGGRGNDTYIVDSTTDGITDSQGIDTVQSSVSFSLAPFSFLEHLTLTGNATINATGNRANNTLTGNSANNILDGGAGIDTLDGGAGNDTYIVDSTTDVITDSDGIDTLQSSVSFSLAPFSFLENLTLTGSSAINATGNNQANTLTGNSANNILDGGTGIDTLDGGVGNDTYIVDSTTDVITDSDGIDTVQSSVSFSLASFSFLEHLTLAGSSAINATGNDQANTLTGNSANNILNGGAGNDTLDGGKGIDTLNGGAGNDTYIVDSSTDVITDSDGIDTVQSSVSFSLAPFSFLEHLTLTGNATINATGNDQANTLTGNSANNILVGGAGSDTLTGGSGRDTFRFTSAPHTNDTDLITDFISGTDKLSFSKAAFTGFGIQTMLTTGQFAVGAGLSAATSTVQRFLFDTNTRLLRFDSDGSGIAQALTVAQFSTASPSHPHLLATDFFLTN